MALTASDSGNSDFKRVPPGAHIARCFSVADCGTQETNGQYGHTSSRKIRLAWEIFGEDENNEPLARDVDGILMPLTINKTYTLSLGEKASLRKDLAAWRGRDFTEEELKGFDLTSVLGVYCMLNVTHSESGGKTYSNVAGISPLHKSMSKPDPIHKNQSFDLDNVDMAVFDTFHEKLQEYIKKSPEWIKFSTASGMGAGSSIAKSDSFDEDGEPF